MIPALLFSFLSTLFFGLFAIYFSIRDEKTKKELLLQNDLQKRQLYEVSTLKALQDKIGYSLDLELVVDTLIGSLKSVFPYSTASSLYFKDDSLIFKTTREEAVSEHFIQQVKKNMIASFTALSESKLPPIIEEIRVGEAIDETNRQELGSFFHIPLVIQSKVMGIISVASSTPGHYKDQDMTFLYRIANQASTALSHLETVIATEKAKLLSLISSLTDAICMIDASNRLILSNESVRKLLEIQHDSPTIADILGHFPSQFDFSAKISEVIKENKIIEEKELSLGKKTVSVTMTPVQGPKDTEQDQVIGVAVVLHDITLEKEISRLKEQFTSDIVHELRSPLTAIQSGSELMIHDNEHIDKEHEKQLLGIINTQSKRMLGDINSLLDAAKLESGHFAIYQKQEDAESLVKETTALFDSEAKKKQITMSLEAEANLPKGLFDAIRIQQVLNNLISNSLKYTPEGGKIVIQIKKYYKEQLPPSPTNPGLLIAITDTGIGIPPDKQASLFSKFSRLENIGFVHSKQGTGLGLYITKGIVESHGGKIFLESMPNKGTTVSFTLPISKEAIRVTPSIHQIKSLSVVN